jgi:hypothetical protein
MTLGTMMKAKLLVLMVVFAPCMSAAAESCNPAPQPCNPAPPQPTTCDLSVEPAKTMNNPAKTLNDGGLTKFGTIVGCKPQSASDPATFTYFFQMSKGYNFPNTNQRMVIQLTCTKFGNKASGNPDHFFCTAGSLSGAPLNFPPAFLIPPIQ